MAAADGSWPAQGYTWDQIKGTADYEALSDSQKASVNNQPNPYYAWMSLIGYKTLKSK